MSLIILWQGYKFFELLYLFSSFIYIRFYHTSCYHRRTLLALDFVAVPDIISEYKNNHEYQVLLYIALDNSDDTKLVKRV